MKKLFSFLLVSCLISQILEVRAEISLSNNPLKVQALSECLAEQKATMYGTKKCGHCQAQKEMFGPYFKNIRFVDCRANRESSRECNRQNIGKFPQWIFPNGQVIVREASLDTIAQRAGCLDSIQGTLPKQDNSPDIYTPQLNSEAAYPQQKAQTVQNELYGSPSILAQCLKSKNIKFYGSPNCSHCNTQKKMFEGAFEEYLSTNFHNCKGSRADQAEW